MSWLLSLAVSLGTGILSALGVGGGSLLVLWLTAFAGLSPESARLISLLYFFPTAGAALLLHRKHGLLKKRLLLPAALAGCAAALGAALLSRSLDPLLLRRSCGLLLTLLGLRELFAAPRKGDETQDEIKPPKPYN